MLSKKVKTFYIKDLERPDEKTYKESLKIYGGLGLTMYPINVREQRMMLDKEGIINNTELFKAVCNGYEIDLS